jgi:4-hydroxy-4-methyl-2-oxoglutarate aldolase
MKLGSRVITDVQRPSADAVERLLACRSCDISDVMNRSGTMVGIGAIYENVARIAGPAVTVSIPAGGINMVKMGIQQARAGDVMVVTTHGAASTAMLGGNISLGMQRRGIKAFVIDGAVRDRSEIRELQFPTFARAVVATAADLGGPLGEVNVPIACGGVVVNPGDIIVADEDGIVVVPPAFADEIVAAVDALEAKHEQAREVLRRGEVTAIDRITQDFVSQGLTIEPSDGKVRP